MKSKIMMALLSGASALTLLAGSANGGDTPLIAFYCKDLEDSFAGDPGTIKKVGTWTKGRSFAAQEGLVYEQKETLGKILTEAVDGQTIPLELYYNKKRTDNMAATELVSQGQGDTAKGLDYQHVCTLGHVYRENDAAKSRVLLKLWWNESKQDYSLAVSSVCEDKAMMAQGFTDQGIIGYALAQEPKLIQIDVSEGPPNATITGSLKEPFKILFDTGSWTTSFPESAVDPDKRDIIKEGPVDNGWGDECRLVKGQLAMVGKDGTKYTVDDMEFYEILKTKKDGTEQSGKVIMGAFPSLHPDTKKPSFSYALAQKYSTPDTFGFGFVSKQPALEVGVGWKQLELYLLLGAGSQKTEGLNWRKNIPNAHTGENGLKFCPEMVPGFTFRVNFPESEPPLESVALQATIDTGAPDLTLRLGEDDPHLKPQYAAYFTSKGPEWWKMDPKGPYATDAKSLEKATVTVVFEGSDKTKDSYTFKADGALQSPGTLYAGKWGSSVPWPVSDAAPKDRINLGNTIYYYCPVFFYDIANKRVGFRFPPPARAVVLAPGSAMTVKQKYWSENKEFYAIFQDDGNFRVSTKTDGYKWDIFTMKKTPLGAKKMILDPTGNLVFLDGNDKPIWSIDKLIKPVANSTLNISNSGDLLLLGPDGAVLWNSSK